MTKQEIEIVIGKGKIRMVGPFLQEIYDKSFVLSLISVAGPCKDESCQVIKKLKVSDRSGDVPSHFTEVKLKSLSLFMDKVIYSSIDRGRETVTIRFTKGGRFFASGFAYLPQI